MDAVSTTDEAFTFVDRSNIVDEVPANIETEVVAEDTSEFEGFGSMFD
jgi:hypothetical protein